jgi:UDP-N-acetylmuramoylalanine--D-glutamate ligase
VLAGVSYYDDSKGTNVDATLKSLEGFPDGTVVVILGGKDKGDDFARLAPLVSRKARAVLTIGAAGPAVGEALESSSQVVPCGTLDVAVARPVSSRGATRCSSRRPARRSTSSATSSTEARSSPRS